MPPRFAYWTILVGNTPTAFRARDQADLLPTLHQLRRTNKDVVMKWFAHGRLWVSPDEARQQRRDVERAAERRGKDWRPGGEHRDPRARKPAGRKRPWTGRGPNRRDQAARKDAMPTTGAPRTPERARSDGRPFQKPWTPRPTGPYRPHAKPHPRPSNGPGRPRPERDQRSGVWRDRKHAQSKRAGPETRRETMPSNAPRTTGTGESRRKPHAWVLPPAGQEKKPPPTDGTKGPRRKTEDPRPDHGLGTDPNRRPKT